MTPKNTTTCSAHTQQYKTLHLNDPEYGASSLCLYPEVCLIIDHLKPASILDYGCGKAALIDKISQTYKNIKCHKYDPSIEGIDKIDIKKVDLVINTDVLEHIPEGIIDSVLSEISTLSQVCFFNLHHGPAKHILPNGENAHCTIKPPDWYHHKLKNYFPEITPLMGRSEITSVVITTTIPKRLILRYNKLIIRQELTAKKHFVRLISCLIPIRSSRRKFRLLLSN